jgi:hypothetical protein
MLSVTIRSNASGNLAYLRGFGISEEGLCPLRTSLYQPGCRTVAVRNPALRKHTILFKASDIGE